MTEPCGAVDGGERRKFEVVDCWWHGSRRAEVRWGGGGGMRRRHGVGEGENFWVTNVMSHFRRRKKS